MKLFIRIKNGQPFEHPLFEDNLREAFPEVDVDNLPPEFARFERVERPSLGVYEILDSKEPVYQFVDGICKDVWLVRDMTADEKAAKQQAVITAFRTRRQAENWATWTLDEATCKMVPPVPYPEHIEGQISLWCGAENQFKITPPRPEDKDIEHHFDFLAWRWVPVVN